MNIKQLLEYGIKLLKENNIDEPILKTRILLANILNETKEYLMVHELEELDEDLEKTFKEDISKVCKHIPIQYITNKQEFMGLEFYVDENVLIPQPDTEILVEEVIDLCVGVALQGDPKRNIKILDLCTGSGAIGISIAKNIDYSEITLSDISNDALKIARKNVVGVDASVDPNKLIKIIQSDLFENIEDKFDIIVSNPPYIKSDVIKTLDKEVQNEPILALDGGEDGLYIYRKIIEQAYRYLNGNGYLCLEIGYDQKEEVIKLIEETNRYTDIYSKKDLADNDRIVICKSCQKSIE
jgi:release factor glutamine methyltransferase